MKLKSSISTLFFRFFFVFFVSYFLSVSFFETDASELTTLKKRLERILKDPWLKNTSYGISIVSIKNNTPIFHYRSNDLFRVASNLKILTTAAALEYLGSDFTYKTAVLAGGVITSSGVLRGDIILKGSGDPNISGRFYDGNVMAVPESWVRAVKQLGIAEISGDVIVDDTIFDRNYINPNWPENQLSEWYCAPVCALPFNDNCVDITILPDNRPGKRVKLLIEPNTSYFTIRNHCVYTSNRKEHSYAIFRKSKTNQIYVKGKFWVKGYAKKTSISVYNPSLYLATVFKETLKKNDIKVNGHVRLPYTGEFSKTGWNRMKIAQMTSTMEQTVHIANKRSQNLYAEQILKTLGAIIKGRGSTDAGIEVLYDFMKGLGFFPDEYFVEDGSGLSKGNKLSPRMLTAILTYMKRHRFGNVYYESLPVSGVDGGLRKRMQSAKYKRKIRAKTGYIADTSSLSGYIETSSGDELAFSILMNDFKSLSRMRKIQDDICKALVDCL